MAWKLLISFLNLSAVISKEVVFFFVEDFRYAIHICIF